MDLSLLGQNLLAPPVLFFVAGVLAVVMRSDLEIPQPLPRLFSLY
ncbi:MAG: sodium-dependent bicarbonate transport family permease, partial [Chloroflexota bacterium]